MNITAKEVSTIPSLGHREAMTLAGAEYDRFISAVEALAPEDWSRQTDNDQWDVKAMVAHVRGMMDMNARVAEMFRQQRAAGRASKRNQTLAHRRAHCAPGPQVRAPARGRVDQRPSCHRAQGAGRPEADATVHQDSAHGPG